MGKKNLAKQKILDVSTALLSEGKFSEITIRQICGQADVSIGAFYHNFKSKSDIMLQILGRDANRTFENFKQNLNHEQEAENIRSYIDYQIQLLEKADISVLKYIYSYEINRLDSSYLSPYMAVVETIIKRGIEKKQFSDRLPVSELVKHIFSLILGNSVRYCIDNGDYPVREELTGQVEHILTLIDAN